MTKNEFNNKWDNLMLYGICGSTFYFFLNNNHEIHIECKFCEDIKLIPIDRIVEMANDLKNLTNENK